MGGPTKLRFPLPHRRQKKQQHEVQSISSPMTNKAQKFLGTAEINVDASSPTSPSEASKIWDTLSSANSTTASGISVTISESTATGTTTRKAEGTVTGGTRGRGRATWDQESDIIPKGLGLSGSGVGRSQMLDAMTDDSSLRRRRSSSTIVSYYDKSKLPLSISQQTSNSAMAKGLPNKAAELLDMECPRPAPSPPKQDRKKPSRLDFTHLLPTGASSRLARFAQKSSMVLGPDLLTRSPSVMSTPPALSPAEFDARPEGRLRRKLTKESLRSLQSPRSDQRHSSFSPDTRSASLRKRATDTGNLHHLYEHYEQTSIRDTMTRDMVAALSESNGVGNDEEGESKLASRRDLGRSASTASPLSVYSNRHRSPSYSSITRRHMAAYTPDEDCGPIAENPRVSVASSSLMSPPTDYAASVSSRHTRTSKATQKTEQSFADFDPNATSVLSLSSDSEGDDLDPPKTGTSVPSVHSRDSMSGPAEYRRPNTSRSQDSNRSQPKSRFHNSFTSQAPFLPIPEHAKSTTPTPPPINPRTSSLTSAITGGSGQRPSVSTTSSSIRSPSRLSQISTSTTESVPSHFSRPRPSASSSVTSSSPRQPTEVRHVAMLQSCSAVSSQKRSGPAIDQARSKTHAHLSTSVQNTQPTPPLSPSSMEFVPRGPLDGNNDNGGPILTLNGTGAAEDERFMAVTRQEEMLLAAMRAKRALMRENLHIADVADMDRGNGSRNKTASKKESLSSIKTVKANTLRPPQAQTRVSHKRDGSKTSTTVLGFPEPPSTRLDTTQPNEHGEHQEVLMCLDRTISTINAFDMAEPSPDLSDFIIDFDADQFPSPPKPADSVSLTDRFSHSRTPSSGSVAGQLTQRRTTRHRHKPSLDRPRPDSEFMGSIRPPSGQAPPMPSYKGVDLDAVSHAETTGTRDARDRDANGREKEGLRTNSSFSMRIEEFDSKPQPSKRKEVRISAVGMQLPEVAQWGDDG